MICFRDKFADLLIIIIFICILLQLVGCSNLDIGESDTDSWDSMVIENTQSDSISALEENTDMIMDLGIQADNFFWKELDDEIKSKIVGISYPDTEEKLEIGFDDLAYVQVLHYDFNGEVKVGELVCNRQIADDLVEIFEELYRNEYQIEKIRLIDEYGADDLESMADNNSSAFNYRFVSGTNKLSNHSYGAAIDINPLYNPYVFYRNGKHQVQPLNAYEYVDRDMEFEHKITHEDLCYKLFIEHGFTWGGDWSRSKDYQHFEKKIL